ncbi:hypothetical protein SSX86_023016 [Deinandra increscens subsp. villosa]|uniref:DUF4283 domain-containing protein n=1 Tax=Deinandra increscens subsp. villosa TaxID=3103831 RepID=A0AAP0CLJ6_9ASTR
MGNLVLTVNLELFDRDRKPVNRRNQTIPTAQATSFNNNQTIRNTSEVNSYASVVGKVDEPSIEKCVFLKEDESIASKEWRKNSLIGRVIDISTLNSTQDFLNGLEAGCIVRYIGGLCVLLSFQSTDDALGFRSKQKVWEGRFTQLDPWEGQFVPFERFAYLDLIGLPPHLWGGEVFNNIGGLFGVVVKESDADDRDFNLAHGSVIILTSDQNPIKQSVAVCVNGRKFRCCVKETSTWEPYFISGNPLFHVSQQEESVQNVVEEPQNVNNASPEGCFPATEDMEEGEIPTCMEGGVYRGSNDEDSSIGNPKDKPYVAREDDPGLLETESDPSNRGENLEIQKDALAGQDHSSNGPVQDRHNEESVVDRFSYSTPVGPSKVIKEKTKSNKSARVQSVSPNTGSSGPTKPCRKKGVISCDQGQSQETVIQNSNVYKPTDEDIVKEVIETMYLGPVVGMDLTGFVDKVNEVVKGDSVKSVS